MRLTKYSHACVRIEDGDCALVIDPGISMAAFGVWTMSLSGPGTSVTMCAFLACDCETLPASGEAMIRWSMVIAVGMAELRKGGDGTGPG